MSSARSGKGSHDDAEAGSKDERNLLVTVIANVALELMPSLIVVENVPAFFTRKVHHPIDKKSVSAANYLISSLEEYYIAFPLVADLSDFGIPQSRNRAFLSFVRRDVVGLRDLLEDGYAPFPKATHGSAVEDERPVTIAEALAKFDLPSLDAGNEKKAHSTEHNGFHSVPVWDERTYAMVEAIPSGSGLGAWDNNICHCCGPVKVLPESVVCPQCSMPLLRPVVKEDNGSYRLVKGFKSSYRRMYPDRPAATITTASGHIGSDYTIHPTQNRLLSPLECSVLQTFPQDFKWGEALKKFGHTNIREMIGEAVPPAFTELHGAVLQNILHRDRRHTPMFFNDKRIIKGWRNLSLAARKDSRLDPRFYFDYSKPQSRRPTAKKNKTALTAQSST